MENLVFTGYLTQLSKYDQKYVEIGVKYQTKLTF